MNEGASSIDWFYVQFKCVNCRLKRIQIVCFLQRMIFSLDAVN